MDSTVAAGAQTLKVRRGDLEFETDKFLLKKGDALALKVELMPGKIQVTQGEKIIGSRALPVGISTVADRAAAEWALSLGGRVTIEDNGIQTNNNTANNGIALGTGTSGAAGGAQNWTETFTPAATWSYGPGGSLVSSDDVLYQGDYGGNSGYAYHSWIEWGVGSLGDNLNTVLNYSVQSVTLTLTNMYSYYADGTTVSFHSGTTLGNLTTVSNELQNWAMGEGQTLATELIGTAWAPFKSGGLTYTVLHPPSSSLALNYAGYWAGPDIPAQQPLLTVKYNH